MLAVSVPSSPSADASSIRLSVLIAIGVDLFRGTAAFVLVQSSVTASVIVLLVLSVALGPVAPAAGEVRTDRPTPQPPETGWHSVTNDTGSDHPAVTDRGDGRYRIHVATGDPRMIVDLDRSLLQSPLDPGALTMSARGSIGGERVVSTAIGVRFAGVDDPWTFIQDPFEDFDVVSRTSLSLPFPTNTSAISDASGAPAVTPVDEDGGGNGTDDETPDARGERA
jgi:hypothetical protein